MNAQQKKRLTKKLDGIFSIYIRLRDADEYGYCQCCTCNKRDHWTKMDNGHYINRGTCFGLKFNEDNCNAQCKHCNRFREGNQHRHAEYIRKKHGQEMLDRLEYQRRFKKALKTEFEYWELIKMYFNLAKTKAAEIGETENFIAKASQGHVLGKKVIWDKEYILDKNRTKNKTNLRHKHKKPYK